MRIGENTLAPSHMDPEKKNKNEDEEDRMEYTHTDPRKRRIPWRRNKGTAMMCQCHQSICGEELMKKKRRCSSDVSVPLQYQFKKSWRRRKECAAMMCQCHCNIHGEELFVHPKPKINYWAWLWMMIIQQMKPSLSLLQMTSSLLMMRLKTKDRKPREKMTTPQGWILCFLSEKEVEVPINNELIGVTTKPWWDGRAPQHYSIYYDEEMDDNLDEYSSVYMTLWYPSSD